jgi:PPOX class probable F420-dependent enzyme
MELSTALSFAREHHRGVLTTIRPDGRPQLSNIVYALGGAGAAGDAGGAGEADGDIVRISVTESRAKTRNLRRDPRGSLHVSRDDFWAWVVLEGEAELSPVAEAPDDATVEELAGLYRAVQGEHDAWDDFRAAMVRDRRLVVRLRPARAYGMLPG